MNTPSRLKDAALNRVIGLNKHLDEAHIDLDRLKLVFFSVFITMFKWVENKTGIAPPMLIVIERYIIWGM